MSRAAKASPTFWSMGGGAAALTAHSWIRHCTSTVEHTRYARVFHCRQWSNYNLLVIRLECVSLTRNA